MDEVVFGRYRLIALIGEGGMGKVYKAHDSVIGRDVAIKVLPTELSAEPGYRERFRREAYTAARLTEPHIIPIYDTGEVDGQLYLVMPVIDGVDLQGLLAHDGPMSPQRSVHVIAQLAAALHAAHTVGLVHRDIKPSNALVTADDFVYLIDFGIAHDAAATKLTSTGMVVGTWAYMAPERFTTGTADARSDVYALACVLYECLTGVQPFPGDSMEQQVGGHLTLDPPKPSRLNPAILAGFDDVIATGMAKIPDQRYQTARELASAAQQALTTATSQPPSAPTLLAESIRPATEADTAQPEPADSPPSQHGGKSGKPRQVIKREKLGALTKIGQGGQGVVYQAPNVKTKFASSMVYKEYKPQTRAGIDFTALAAMPALVEESLSYAQAERLISCAAWPCALVEDAGAPTGFVMPAIPEAFFLELTTVKGVSRTTAEFQHLLNHSSVLAARGIELDDVQRYTLLREAASALAFIHKHGVCVGDISPKNLLFSLTPHEAIYFIDCDAMRINGVSALPQMETPGWDAPSGEELATIYTDAYKLGLLALRLLAGDHDTKNPHHIPAATPNLLRQAITDTLTGQAHSRPLPEAWTYVLGHAIEHAQHHQKTAAAVTASPSNIALAPPPTPVVHSRPPASTPPSRPPTPPPPQPPPPPPPAWPQPAPSSSRTPLLIGVGLAGLVVAAVVVLVVVLANQNNFSPSSAPATSSEASAYPSDSYATSTTSSANTPTASVPPPDLVQTPDSYGVSCSNGYHRSDRSGWATNSGRGTDGTSCLFANNVLQAYWNTYPSPSRDSREVIAGGTVPCPDVNAHASTPIPCSGNDFIMTCVANGNDPWITCTGGNDAKVYLY
ncbi:MAG TPA: protein kinase [Mycobacterium sp.]|uniref:protein kinase domain-containing protein n=1 Tax=Mycobacterium sp. TaxID=1785 RepID=UPI002D2BD5BB|nr:protein kinase [Mycobacterium sp.]HZU47126.1 protein kinase [Mycobacterium sp.]